MSKFLFVVVLAGVLLSACVGGGSGQQGDWQKSENPIQQAECSLFNGGCYATEEAAPNGQHGRSAMEGLVKDFSGRACLESVAENTGKQYVCPDSRTACEKLFNNNGQIVIDDYGFVSCVDSRTASK